MPRALIIVDVQNDFCEGGALAVAGGVGVAGAIAEYVQAHGDEYAAVAATQDWHVNPGDHFASTPPGPDYVNTWPVHCRAGTHGADSHPALAPARPRIGAWFRKGEYAAAYSGFEGATSTGTTLEAWLHAQGVDAVDVVGIATDHCVRATAIDAVTAGFATRVLLDLTAGVAAGTTAAALPLMEAAGVTLEGTPVTG